MQRMFVSKDGFMYRLSDALRIDNFLLNLDEKDGFLIRADGMDVDVTCYVNGHEAGFRVVQMGLGVTDA